MLLAGSLSSIAVKAFPGKEIILHGWIRKQKRLAQEEKTESKRQKALERELEWVRMNPKGRQAKGKARLSAYEKLLSQETREKEEKLELFIPPGPRLGK